MLTVVVGVFFLCDLSFREHSGCFYSQLPVMLWMETLYTLQYSVASVRKKHQEEFHLYISKIKSVYKYTEKVLQLCPKLHNLFCKVSFYCISLYLCLSVVYNLLLFLSTLQNGALLDNVSPAAPTCCFLCLTHRVSLSENFSKVRL